MSRISFLALFSLLSLAVLVYSDEKDDDIQLALNDFNEFTASQGRRFRSNAERQVRFANFRKTRSQVISHNAAYRAGKVDYEISLNQFSDMTADEVVQKFTGLVQPTNGQQPVASFEDEFISSVRSKRQTVPVSYDMTQFYNIVHNQGQCGSCYIFSAIGNIEMKLATMGKNVSLSEQFVLDCAVNAYMMFGCNGGWPSNAWDWINGQKGTPTAASYPYVGAQSTCKSNVTKYTEFSSVKYKQVSSPSQWVQSMISCNSSISAAVGVDQNFYLYKSGIYTDQPQNRRMINHAILLVGYGVDEATNTPYWLGMNGYMKIRRDNNTANLEVTNPYVLC